MVYTVKESDKYFWSFDGNLDKPEKERAWAEISLPTFIQVMEAGEYRENNTAFEFLMYVKSVHNYKIVVDGKEKEATPKDIVSTPGLAELALELYNRYKKYISVDKKKLSSDSGSKSSGSK